MSTVRKRCWLLSLFFIQSCSFFELFTEKPKTIGAIAPSSGYLGQAMIKHINCDKTPKRILEVGAGTGVMTAAIESCLKPQDELIVYEVEDKLCDILESKFNQTKKNIQIRCKDITSLKKDEQFDYIVSTLPFNVFSVNFVKDIFDLYFNVLKDDGVLSFFEYLYLSSFRKNIGTKESIKEVRALRDVIETTVKEKSFEEENVWMNITPAVVYYLKK